MNVFAIADLHLSFDAEKPMDIFGGAWANHPERLETAWRERVRDTDVVLIAGDVSWAMQLEHACRDLAFIGALPGTKLILRGNHDYWWSSLTRVRAALPPSVRAIQNDALTLGAFSFGGTRGWTLPGAPGFSADDEKIYRRELGRLELSLNAMDKSKRRIAMLHYPPFDERSRQSGFSELLEAHGVADCVYGHLHGAAHRGAFTGERGGVRYHFVAGDYLAFAPVQIA